MHDIFGGIFPTCTLKISNYKYVNIGPGPGGLVVSSCATHLVSPIYVTWAHQPGLFSSHTRRRKVRSRIGSYIYLLFENMSYIQ